MTQRLQDRVCIVTGAARGIGQAITNRLLAEGARLAAVDIDQEALAQAPYAGGSDENVLRIPCDITRRAEVDAMVRQVEAAWGGVDGLVNNAGWSIAHSFLEDDEDFWEKVIGINLLGAYRCVQAVVPSMRSRGGGGIVNIASDSGRVGTPLQAAYAGAKAGLIGFAKSVAVELAQWNIRINVVSPSVTATRFLTDLYSPEQIAQRAKAIPLGRVGQPEDIADAVQFFLSDDARFITGQTLSVNGGVSRLG